MKASEIKNVEIVNLIEKIIAGSGNKIPNDLKESLKDYLADATLICPSVNDDIISLQIGEREFIPASCDLDDFKRTYKEDDVKPKVVEFGYLSKYLNAFIDGIIINPGSFGFIINPAFASTVFSRINDKNMIPPKKGYDVKIRLNDFTPLTWRDIIIPENITFEELDNILKTLWGFYGIHLSAFILKQENTLIMDKKVSDNAMMDAKYDSKTTLINDFFDKYDKITYWYDFGDDWKFDIEIKGKIDYDKKFVTIKRFKGNYNPLEDCGGVYGLSNVIWDKEHNKSNELTEYLEEFDMEYTQKLLKTKNYVLNQF